MAMPLTPAPRHGESETVALAIEGMPALATIVRSARRRRTIAIAVRAGAIQVRAPMRATRRQVADALDSHRQWILARLAEPVPAPAPAGLIGDETLPYLGQTLDLQIQDAVLRGPRVRLEGATLVVETPTNIDPAAHPEVIRTAVVSWYRARAVDALTAMTADWSLRTGLVPRAVLIREQKRRWGSCGPDGTLRFNWRLVMADPELLEHVVVHELIHLRHRHHQAGFWADVAQLIPDHRERRRRLNEVARTFPL